MTTSKTDMLLKIKKLLELSKSPNQFEAELALSKVSQLLEEHQLSLSEVELLNEEFTQDIFFLPLNKGLWKPVSLLSNAAALIHDCRALVYRGHPERGQKIEFFGEKEDVILAQATLQYLYDTWKKIAKNDWLRQAKTYPGNSYNFKEEHMIGFAFAIEKKSKALQEQRRGKLIASTGKDVVLIKNGKLDNYIKEKRSYQEKRVAAKRSSALEAGLAAGESTLLEQRVSTQPKMIAAA